MIKDFPRKHGPIFRTYVSGRDSPERLPRDRGRDQPSRSRLLASGRSDSYSRLVILPSFCGRSKGNPDAATGKSRAWCVSDAIYSLALTVRGVVSSSDPRRHRPQRQDHSAINGHFTRRDAGSLRTTWSLRLRLCVLVRLLRQVRCAALASHWWRHLAPARRMTWRTAKARASSKRGTAWDAHYSLTMFTRTVHSHCSLALFTPPPLIPSSISTFFVRCDSIIVIFKLNCV